MGISTLYFLFVQMLPPTKEEILVELPHVKLNTKFVQKKKKNHPISSHQPLQSENHKLNGTHKKPN